MHRNRDSSLFTKLKAVVFCTMMIATSFSLFFQALPVQADETNSSSTSDHLILRKLIDEPQAHVQQLQDYTFTKITMPHTMLIGEKPGSPSFPVMPINILLPYGKEISNLQVIPLHKTSLNLANRNIDLMQQPIIPYQQSLPIGTPEPENIAYLEDVYQSDGPIPQVQYTSLDVQYCRGYPILTLNLHPTEYIPQDGTLSYFNEFIIDITLKDVEQSNVMFRDDPNDEAWVRSLVSNPEQLDSYHDVRGVSFEYAGGLCDPADNYDYVVILRDALADMSGQAYTWTDFINRKASEGLAVAMVTVEDILATADYESGDPLFDDEPGLIREFVKDAYQDWGISYVFVVGDVTGPGAIERRLMSSSAESNVEAEIYWSNLDNTFNADGDGSWGEEGDAGFDLFSDVFIGSIPADEALDISNWMTKSFYYADSTEKDYLDNAGFYGGDTGWNCQGDDFIDFTIYGTDNYMGPNPNSDGPWPNFLGFLQGFDTWNASNPGYEYNCSVKWTAEPPNPGWQGGSESAATEGLRDAISNDLVTILNGIAHADASMSLDVGYAAWESDYHNTKPFFIHDYGCHCGEMIGSDDGVLHSMLFHSDTELAFACVYNTGYGWGNFDTTNSSSALQQKLFWEYCFNLSVSGNPMNWQLARAQQYAKDILAPSIDWEGSFRENIQCSTLFGDPAQLLKIPFVPDHDISVTGLSVDGVVPHGETQIVSANVRNVGNNSETGIVVDFVVDDVVLDTTTIASLDSMESQLVSFSWDPAVGTYVVGVESHSIPDEYDLGNNVVNRTVDVVASPQIDVAPLSLSYMVPTDATDMDVFTIFNLVSGEALLDYNISFGGDLGGSWLSASPDVGSVVVGGSELVTVTVDTAGMGEGEYQGYVLVSCNDVDDPSVIVGIDLVVVYGDDFAAVSVNGPTGVVPYGIYTVNATVQNLGFYDQTDVLVNCSIFEGFLDYEQDFEADDGNYIANGGLWEYGTPTSGPGGAHSGDFCWGTDLDANYGNDEDATLDSPEIMIPNGVTATLSFWQYYDTESYYDGGNVKISTDGGATWQLLGAYLDPYPEDAASSNNEGIPGEPCFSSASGGWQEVSFDLSAYGGETIMLRWHFGSDGSVTDPGWFIDDVLVTGEYGGSRADNVLVFSTTETISLNAYESTDIEFTPDWVAGGGNYTIQITTLLSGDEDVTNDIMSDVVFVSGPTLSCDPTSHDFGTIMINTTNSTTFDIWNSGVGTLTYSLSESEGWLDVSPLSGDSTGEHDTITVDIDTTGMTPGVYHADIAITSDGGNGNVGIDLFVVNSITPILDIEQIANDRGFPIRHAADGDWAAAQDFLPTMNSIAKVDLYLRKFGTPEFDLVVELREGGIDGTLLDTVVFTPAEVTSTWDYLEVDFADTPVTPGVQYFIVCPPAPIGVTTSFGYEWGYAFGNQYDDGAFWFTRDSGTLWRDLPAMYEFTFKTYGLL